MGFSSGFGVMHAIDGLAAGTKMIPCCKAVVYYSMIRICYFLSLFLSIALLTAAQNQHYLITGTYTPGKSEGIYVYLFNSKDGSSKEMSHVKISNPSFVAVSPDERFVYAVKEEAAENGKGGEIAAFSFSKSTGMLSLINQQASGGDHPCYVSIDKTGRWVVAGNYSSGSLAVLPVQSDGSLGAASTVIRHEGKGLNMQRQTKPHVHCTFFSDDNRFLFVPDLGIDKVMIYSFDETTGKLAPAPQVFAKSADGAGPRHICFHPSGNYAYLLEELSGTVQVFDYKNGTLKKKQRISTMPSGDMAFAGSADIHVSPDGRFLYASNRAESNTIAIFRINRKDGRLTLISHQSTLGKTPRNFNFDPTGNFLLVGNQHSDEIVVFRRNKKTGLLTDTGNRISVGKPVCLKWIAVNKLIPVF